MSRQKYEEAAPGVPLWVITFSDMTTNLLTFFVLLVSMGTIRDETLFDSGRRLSSLLFFQAVKRGLGVQEPNFDNTKIKYLLAEGDKGAEGRTIDATSEEIRRMFKKIVEDAKAKPMRSQPRGATLTITEVRFAPGRAELDESATNLLKTVCSNLQQQPMSPSTGIYVVGLAGDGRTEKEEWIISAQRAQKAAELIEATLYPADRGQTPAAAAGPRIHAIGAGPGGDWAAGYRHAHILIAVVQGSN